MSSMARGFDSKSVEEQQSEAARIEPKHDGQRPTPEEIERRRKRASMELVLTKIRNDLQNSTDPRHRQMLEMALEDMEKKLGEM